MNAWYSLLGCFPPWIYRDGNFYWQGDLQTISLPCSVNQIEFNIYQSETNSVRMNPSPNFVSFELQNPNEVRTCLFNLLALPRPGCGLFQTHSPFPMETILLLSAQPLQGITLAPLVNLGFRIVRLYVWGIGSYSGVFYGTSRGELLIKPELLVWSQLSLMWALQRIFLIWCHCSSKLLCEKAAREMSLCPLVCHLLASTTHLLARRWRFLSVCFLFIGFFCLASFLKLMISLLNFSSMLIPPLFLLHSYLLSSLWTELISICVTFCVFEHFCQQTFEFFIWHLTYFSPFVLSSLVVGGRISGSHVTFLCDVLVFLCWIWASVGLDISHGFWGGKKESSCFAVHF